MKKSFPRPELRDDDERQLGSVFATKSSIVIKSSENGKVTEIMRERERENERERGRQNEIKRERV